MTTNKKDKTEDILEKVKDVLEKKDEKRWKKRGCAMSASSLFESVSIRVEISITFL